MSILLSWQKNLLTRYILGSLLFASVALVIPPRASAYIMPAEEILGLMMANFSKFKTVVITQTTHLFSPSDQEPETVFRERLWIKSPGYLRGEFVGPVEGEASESRPAYSRGEAENREARSRLSSEISFRRLLMANDGRSIMMLLSEMGVNLESVSFTRFNRIIAYRIGDKDPESPMLLIEKERFLPLLFTYRIVKEAGHTIVTVRFDDYRKLTQGWYPYEISYVAGKEVGARYGILDLQINVPVETSEYKTGGEETVSPQGPGSEQEPLEEERLREIIRLLKEKYRRSEPGQ
jgi:hypothetical protein